jgi:hypothetical protein
MLETFYNYLKYSGISVILTLNPFHWRYVPWFRNETNDEWGSAEYTYGIGFLALTIRVWFDNGEW